MLLGCLSVGSTALATPPAAPPLTPITDPNPPVVGLLDGRTKAKNDGIEFKTRTDTNSRGVRAHVSDRVVFGLALAPGNRDRDGEVGQPSTGRSDAR